MIHVKCGVEVFSWRTKEARGAYGVVFWKDILKEFFWVNDNWYFKFGEGT